MLQVSALGLALVLALYFGIVAFGIFATLVRPARGNQMGQSKEFTGIQLMAYAALINHPCHGTGRWHASRKLALLAAIECGAITPEEARAKFAVSAEEIDEWRRGILRPRDSGSRQAAAR